MLSDLVLGAKGVRLERDKDVTGVTSDSREVLPGFLFVAIPGFQLDGHEFIPHALKRGAVAVVAERNVFLPPEVGFAVAEDSRAALSHISSVFFQNPSDMLFTVGVTGTKGKTTTTHMVKTILDQAGLDTGLIGTVRNIVGGKTLPVTHTTPESYQIQKLLRDMVDSGSTAVSMEVSSHALSLHRVADIHFDVGVFTNIGRDHLDFHGTMENYVSAKTRLFQMLSPKTYKILRGKKYDSFAILNMDDPYFERFREHCAVPVVTYGLSPKANVRAENLKMGPWGSQFTLCYEGGKKSAFIHIPGEFNVRNALSAAALGLGLGCPLSDVAEFLTKVSGVPGRVQVLKFKGDFTVWVDYSHTPESLENILLTARQMTRAKVIVVFGCGGDRDKGKRPIMGEIAARLSDVAVITDDNPRTEPEDAILDDIEEGLRRAKDRKKSFNYMRIKDRHLAISEAIKMASEGDIVVLAGKGHETYQVFKDKTIHFDDAEEAKKAITSLGRGEVS